MSLFHQACAWALLIMSLWACWTLFDHGHVPSYREKEIDATRAGHG